MIASLRSRHRLIFGVLTPLVLGLLILALVHRPPTPASEGLPDALATSVRAVDGETLFERSDFFTEPRVAARLVRTGSGQVLELETASELRQPHVLVYWRPPGAPPGVADAHLLGQLLDARKHAFTLPGSGGEVVLYSLAHQQELASAALPGRRGGGGR